MVTKNMLVWIGGVLWLPDDNFPFVRFDVKRRELVFLRLEGRGNLLENQTKHEVRFRGTDDLFHLCDLELGHLGECKCLIHEVEACRIDDRWG